jgi:hypothetical protein
MKPKKISLEEYRMVYGALLEKALLLKVERRVPENYFFSFIQFQRRFNPEFSVYHFSPVKCSGMEFLETECICIVMNTKTGECFLNTHLPGKCTFYEN